MFWPQASDYREAVQNLALSFRDQELIAGQAASNALGLPTIWTGNFASVFHVQGTRPQQNWAVKCFTKDKPGLQERYREIHAHLQQQRQRLPFMVGFSYLPEEVLVRGQRYPLLKMDWVEGLRLDEFLADLLTKADWKPRLRRLCEMWLRLAQMLREAQVAHGDLQHGNVLLVPVTGKEETFNLRLIDYDGMCVPALLDQPPGEVGHPAYQHPQRLARGTYGLEIDRFSHLVIYTTLRCLIAGRRELWERHYDGDRLLLGHQDLTAPDQSAVFRELWQLEEPAVRNLVGHLTLAAKGPLEEAPPLSQLVLDSKVVTLSAAQQGLVDKWLSAPAAVHVPMTTVAPIEPSLPPEPEPEVAVKIVTAGTRRKRKRRRGEPAQGAFSLKRLRDQLLSGGTAAVAWVRRGRRRAVVGIAVVAIACVLVFLGRAVLLNVFQPSPAQAPPSAVAPFDAAKRHQSHWVAHLKLPVEITNSIGMKLVLIPPGQFQMGSPESDKHAGSDEKPQHRVRITKPFYLSVYEVTQAEYQQLMGANPSHFIESGETAPVESVSWDEAVEFCRKLSASAEERAAGGVYRLPTEAEWEYACRAGTATRYCSGDDAGELGEHAWHSRNSGGMTHRVGEKNPNAWGLYDMHGNVHEWCADWYESVRYYYAHSLPDDPTGPTAGSGRVIRGGGWSGDAGDCRSAYRGRLWPGYRNQVVGFRVARSPSGR